MAVETTRRRVHVPRSAGRSGRGPLPDTRKRGRSESPGAPVLIFEIDAGGLPEDAAPARKCDVRLIGSVRSGDGPGGRLAGQELSAVLVLRSITPSRLLSCVRAVSRGRPAMAPEVLCQMLPNGTADGNGRAALPDLAPREYDVLRMLADGDTTREIAQQLSYSERTVKSIVHDVLAKLNCRTRAHAVALAVRQGVI